MSISELSEKTNQISSGYQYVWLSEKSRFR